MFTQLQTQWHVGMAGPTGLIYSVLFYLLDRLQLSEPERNQRFADLQVMELAALAAMKKKG